MVIQCIPGWTKSIPLYRCLNECLGFLTGVKNISLFVKKNTGFTNFTDFISNSQQTKIIPFLNFRADCVDQKLFYDFVRTRYRFLYCLVGN